MHNMIKPNSALVVLSGGQDSTTCLGWALHYYDEVRCVSFDYGQKHKIELEAAVKVVEYYRHALGKEITHEIVTLGDNFFAGRSPLTNKDEPLETYDSHEQMEAIIGDRVEKTFVPMRNLAFLVMAANRAVAAECGTLVTGVCEADNANYPDCRRIFIEATQDAINLALGLDRHTYEHFRIATPLINMSKAQSIDFAIKMPAAYEALAFSHTAYNGEYPPTGKDHASVLRAHGFEQAGVPDPLVVRAWMEGVIELPSSSNYDVLREGAEPLPKYLEDLMDMLSNIVYLGQRHAV